MIKWQLSSFTGGGKPSLLLHAQVDNLSRITDLLKASWIASSNDNNITSLTGGLLQ
jgi:hypothetical protein